MLDALDFEACASELFPDTCSKPPVRAASSEWLSAKLLRTLFPKLSELDQFVLDGSKDGLATNLERGDPSIIPFLRDDELLMVFDCLPEGQERVVGDRICAIFKARDS